MLRRVPPLPQLLPAQAWTPQVWPGRLSLPPKSPGSALLLLRPLSTQKLGFIFLEAGVCRTLPTVLPGTGEQLQLGPVLQAPALSPQL